MIYLSTWCQECRKILFALENSAVVDHNRGAANVKNIGNDVSKYLYQTDRNAIHVSDIPNRLTSIAGQLTQVAKRLGSLEKDPSSTGIEASIEVCHFLRNIIRRRQLRGRFFSDTMFADPSWDILLDLTLARLEGRSVSVSSACIAAGVPTTTALRWIKSLLDEGLLTRRADQKDARRHYIEVNDETLGRMLAWAKAAAS